MATQSAREEAGQDSGGAPFVSGARGIRYPAPPYARAFLGLVRAGEAVERRLDADLRAAHGLSLRGYEVLLHLAVFAPDGRLPMSQLIRQAPLSQSRVSRLVAQLEAEGLVRRSVDEQDSRVVVVSLGDAGLQRLRQAQDTHHRGLTEHVFSRLTQSEIVQLGELTAKLLDGRADVDQRSTC